MKGRSAVGDDALKEVVWFLYDFSQALPLC